MSICNDMLRIPLPRYLREHKKEIQHAFDNASGWDYGFEGWQNHFHNNSEVIQDLDIIKQKCPRKISRDDVCYFANKARSGDYIELRRFFLACMIWGWGKGGKDKRGCRNTEAALLDPRVREVLEKSTKRINNGQIKKAYEGFQLKGCRSAFFTKFFYFVGKEYNIKPLPLILDSHVASFLRFLGKEEGWDNRIFTDAKGYLQYICSMYKWASEIGCPPDSLEYFMFKEDKVGMNPIEYPKEDSSMREYRYFTVNQAKEFSKSQRLKNEASIIDKMNVPEEWQLEIQKGKPGSEYWLNRAKIGNYLLLWQLHGITGYPDGKNPGSGWQKTRIDKAWEYVDTQEGRTWQERNRPYWLEHVLPENQPAVASGAPESVMISLSARHMAQLKKLANDFGMNNEVALARIWILERLYQLYKD